MGRHLQLGFTIIEVMLVLAITALMLTAVLNNSSRRINDQHYREGVESFRDFLAGTFEDIDSVKNDVLGQKKRCDGNPFTDSAGATVNAVSWRGSAECFYSGREITLMYNSTTQDTELISRSVKAFVDKNRDSDPQYVATTDPGEENLERQNIDWGVTAMKPKPHSDSGYSNFRLRIVRHPNNGAKMLQIQDSIGAPWQQPAQNIVFCMKNPFLSTVDGWQAVVVDKNTVNSSGITTQNGSGVCGVSV